MDRIAWSLVLLAAVIGGATWYRNRRKIQELKFHIERHGLRLKRWRRVHESEKRDPWRCPECYVTVHGHWAKIGHQQWHDGPGEPAEPWDSVSAEFLNDRAAGTPELPDPARQELGPGDG